MTSTVTIPTKESLSSAALKLEQFLAQNLSAKTTYPATYAYLENLRDQVTFLSADQNYDNEVFRALNADALSGVIPAIDDAIRGCRYTFGVVYAETQAKQAASQPQSPAAQPQAATPAVSQSPVTTVATVAKSSPSSTGISVAISENATKSDASADATTAETSSDKAAPDRSDNLTTSTVAESTPVEIPKTGGISQSASMVFIVLMSLIAATAATGIYYIYSHKPRYTTPSRRKRR